MEYDPTTPKAKPASRRVMKPLLIGCAAVIALFAGLAALGFYLSKEMRETEPYKIAIKRIKEDARVAELLGPISGDPVVSGKITIVNDRGNAALEFSLNGKKTRANVRVLATLADGAWTVDLLEIVAKNGKTLVLQGGTPEAEK
jgi:hypothetical protein